jgi:hypothetical protein
VKDYADRNISSDHKHKDDSDHLSDDGDGVSEDSAEEKAETSFFNNYQEFFKNRSFNPQVLAAPPLEIIAKTGYTKDEPIQTGAPINFLKIEKLIGGTIKHEIVSN